VIISTGITEIGNYAFSECNNLKEVVIPDSVTKIATRAFSDSEGLMSILVSEDNAMFSQVEGVLFNKDKTILVTYPAGAEKSVYTVPDTVVEIGPCAFWNSQNLQAIVFPDTLEVIRESAFQNCKQITSVEIPSSVKSIEGQAFCNCEKLSSVKFLGTTTLFGENNDDGYVYNKEDSEGFGVDDKRDRTFLDTDNLTMYAGKGSNVEKYAKRNGFNFSEI